MINAAVTTIVGTEGRFLERERPSRELASHDTRDARGLRHNHFPRDQGSHFVHENDVVWNKRPDYFFQSESTAMLGHLTMQSNSLDCLSRFTQLVWKEKTGDSRFLPLLPCELNFQAISLQVSCRLLHYLIIGVF